MDEPLRREMANAVQWIGNLRSKVADTVEQMVRKGEIVAKDLKQTLEHEEGSRRRPAITNPPRSSEPKSYDEASKVRTCEYARILRSRCPACFGGKIEVKPSICR
jgi:hypothetical protein